MGYISVTINPINFLFGVQGIRVLINDQVVETLQLGETYESEAHPGEYTVQVELLGVVSRMSNKLQVAVPDAEKASVNGKYSRFWGNIKLKLAA